MPSLDNSIALQIDAIDRRRRTLYLGQCSEDVAWLITTLRREMATNEQLRSSIDHLCARIEEVHDELIISRRRPTT